MDGDSTARAVEQVSRDIRRTIESQTREIIKSISPIKELPVILRDQSQSISTGFQHSIQAQFIITIGQLQAQIAARQQQLREEIEELKRLQVDTKDKTEAISSQLRRDLDKVDADTQAAVMALDGPVLDLGGKYFPDLVFNPMSEILSPFWEVIHETSADSAIDRERVFESVMGDVTKRLGEYEHQWSSLEDGLPGLENINVRSQQAKIPVCVIVTDDDGAVREHIIIAPVWDAAQKCIVPALPWLQQMFLESIDNHLGQIRGNLVELLSAFKAQQASTQDIREFGDSITGKHSADAGGTRR